jgi:hypothetical protein
VQVLHDFASIWHSTPKAKPENNILTNQTISHYLYFGENFVRFLCIYNDNTLLQIPESKIQNSRSEILREKFKQRAENKRA